MFVNNTNPTELLFLCGLCITLNRSFFEKCPYVSLHFSRLFSLSGIIPTRSRQACSKQACLGDLAQIICITFIIQVAWAI